MRTDVKVGLICAFAFVLVVVIYFVARGNGKQPAPLDTGGEDSALLTSAGSTPAIADPALPAVASGSVEGGVISLPSPETSGAAAASPAGPTVEPTTPDMGPTMTTTGFGTPDAAPSGFGTPTLAIPAPTPMTPTPLLPTPTPSTPMELSVPSTPTPPTMTLASGPTTYKIQQGDILGTIARRFGVTVKAIQAANPGIDPLRLQINSVIKIPAQTAAAPAIATPRTTTPSAPRATAVVARSIKPGTNYKIKKGDTLISIAKAAYGNGGEGWKKIFRANMAELTDPNVVPVGAEIVIPR